MREGGETARGRLEPLWRGTFRRVEAWRTVIAGSEYVERAVRFGIQDMPSVPFVQGRVLLVIPQSTEDKEFARGDLERGVREGIYERMGSAEVEELVKKGKMVFSAFVVWKWGRKGSEGTICYLISSAKQELAKRKHENGNDPRLRFGEGEGRRNEVLRLQERVTSLLLAPGHARLLHISVRRGVLQMYSAPVWMGKIGSVVHEVVETAGAVHEREAGVQSAAVSQRLLGGSVPIRESGDREGLRGSKEGVGEAVREDGTAPSSGEGSVGGITKVGAPQDVIGLEGDAGFRVRPQGTPGTGHGAEAADARTMEQKTGAARPVAKFLRHLHVPHIGAAVGAVLHSLSVL